MATTLPVILTEIGPMVDKQYVYGFDLISQLFSETKYFYHYDGLGSIMKLTDQDGDQAMVYAYDPWGAPEKGSHASTDKNRFKFTGEEFDDFTKLYYLRARWYDPSVGRFLTKDPFMHYSHNAGGLNRYVYALNNPLRYTDKSGLVPDQTDAVSITDFRVTKPISFSQENIKHEENGKLRRIWDRIKFAGKTMLDQATGGILGSSELAVEFATTQVQITGQQVIFLDHAVGLLEDGFTAKDAINMTTNRYVPGLDKKVLCGMLFDRAREKGIKLQGYQLECY